MRSVFIIVLIPLMGFGTANKEVVTGNNQFAFDMYQKLPAGKNSFFSPYSISAALAMTYAGAKNTTASDMEKVLHIEQGSTFHQDFGSLMEKMNALNGTDLKMNIANRLFGAAKYKFLDGYLKQLEDVYKAPIERLDFAGKSEASRQHINAWVEKQTNNKIKELIGAGVLNTGTRLVLVNAIYFYGDWASQFKESNTQTGKFYTAGTESMNAKLMYQQAGYDYAETSSFKALRVPYKGHKVSMEIYLPNKKDGLADLEKTLSEEKYSEWSKLFTKHKVDFTLPKFKMTTSFSLGEKLKTLGMASAFTSSADFSGMTGHKDLFISEVVHKAYIDVGEKGTEAAAATAVLMQVTSVHHEPRPEEIKTFKADHPFFFVIRENSTGCILFMGRLTEPTKA